MSMLILLPLYTHSILFKLIFIKSLYYNNGDTSQVQKYNDARLELTKADSAIQNVQSALDSGKSSNEVDSRIDFAKEKLQNATVAYNNL